MINILPVLYVTEGGSADLKALGKEGNGIQHGQADLSRDVSLQQSLVIDLCF